MIEKDNLEPFVMLPLISTAPNINIPAAAKRYSQLFRILIYLMKAGMINAVTSDIATIVN